MSKNIPKIKILVACHKEDPNIRSNEMFIPIHVGKALHLNVNLGFQCDNTGDNISEKNNSYCELTALYWGWKNCKDADYIGLCHYRRYFAIKEERIIDYCKKYNIIAIKPCKLSINVFSELVKLTSYEESYILIDSILELYPDYRNEIIDYYYKGNKFSQFNMLLASKDIYDAYCKFLFPILNLVESRIKKPGYSRQKRVIGYLAESLLGLWLLKNRRKLKIKLVNSVECHVKTNRLKRFVNDLRVSLAFIISKSYSIRNDIPFLPSIKNGLIMDNINLKRIN